MFVKEEMTFFNKTLDMKHKLCRKTYHLNLFSKRSLENWFVSKGLFWDIYDNL